MNDDRSDRDPAERKLDEWAEESRRRQGEAAATAPTPDAMPAEPPRRDDDADTTRTPERADERTQREEHRGGAVAASTADLARAGSAAGDSGPRDGDAASDDDRPTALFAEQEASGFRTRWLEVQTEFVDDPRQAVQRADALVAELMQQLAETFASERSDLEQQWDRGGEVSTEDLRLSLRRYRSFFDRLLSL